MDVELISPLSGRPGRLLRRAERGGWRIAALGATGVAIIVFGWVIVEAPAIESFALAVALAVAWSIWLDRRPEHGSDPSRVAFSGPDISTSGHLSVCVLATTDTGTRSALSAVRQLTFGVDADVVLLIAQRTALANGAEQSDEEAELVRRHTALAAEAGVPAKVLLCVCRDYDDVVHLALDRSSLIIVGGRGRAWWPSAEQRLAARLSAEGYSVMFADERARNLWTPASSAHA